MPKRDMALRRLCGVEGESLFGFSLSTYSARWKCLMGSFAVGAFPDDRMWVRGRYYDTTHGVISKMDTRWAVGV